VPGASGFETSRLYATVSPSDLAASAAPATTSSGATIAATPTNGTSGVGSGSGNGNTGRFRLEFVTVEHGRGDPASGRDLYVRGRRRPPATSGSLPPGTVSGPAAQWIFSARGIDVDNHQSETKVKNFEPEAISDDVMVTSVEFSEPFAYSTSTWVKDGVDTSEAAQLSKASACDKDISKFRPVDIEKAEKYNGVGGNEDEEEVNVFIEPNIETGAYEYTLKSVRTPPYLRLYVPGVELHYFVSLLFSSLQKIYNENFEYLLNCDQLRSYRFYSDSNGVFRNIERGHRRSGDFVLPEAGAF
jgi:hypothetical protein